MNETSDADREPLSPPLSRPLSGWTRERRAIVLWSQSGSLIVVSGNVVGRHVGDPAGSILFAIGFGCILWALKILIENWTELRRPSAGLTKPSLKAKGLLNRRR
ncbi:conserved hypothetical protein [Gluconacetobacter diazotrophicus PA1 5]|uniref:Uncharacterized protein n=2 Tax=Gluconacetobacter diazotrophicus TaxID=33996 RepID=A0A7W4FC37_GLUDI|nr:conserved hypothetical protein [Gluconacetobacter diazotrophicus PA1 5]MBB2154957.1 hypothetical protein [Gluconacetobacter diazotrophicus]TWB08118.1 hypothetical protein FBZ86_108138 [Gluconacetobacter diazotrophicus]CAP56051.1 putative membrane protein [Gluconacetobacter diazotrophicus PA1 5]